MPITWFEVKRKGGLHRGYEWDLTPEYILDLYEKQKGLCALIGQPIGWAEKGLTATVSIDRIDSDGGYLQGNVQLLHKDVNMAKQQYSQDYFVKMCKAVADKVKWLYEWRNQMPNYQFPPSPKRTIISKREFAYTGNRFVKTAPSVRYIHPIFRWLVGMGIWEDEKIWVDDLFWKDEND